MAVLNNVNEIAYLSGVFNWQIENASYTNPSGNATCSFHVIQNAGIPFAQFISGAINTYTLVSGKNPINQIKSAFGQGVNSDPNTDLFNSVVTSGNLKETISRKWAINKVPFANYDQLVDMGTGTQEMIFNVIFAGTMYQTALQNFLQCAFGADSGVGTLQHPFYNKVMNVLPVKFSNSYTFESLNCVVCEVVFMTSDLSHLVASVNNESISQTIQKGFIGVQSAITSIGGTISTLKTFGSQLGGGF